MDNQNAITTTTDIKPVVDMVINSLSSPHSRRAYERALIDFLTWWEAAGKPPLIKSTVNTYKIEVLEGSGLSPSTINQRISAIRKLAGEAADNGFLPQEQANGISRIKGVSTAGVRSGNWLQQEQAQALLNAPDISTLKGLRDRAILAVLVGSGVRRSEIAALTFDMIQQRDGRWVIIDMIGKRNRVRTVPLPSWAKVAIDQWDAAAGLTVGHVFRPMNKGGKITGDQVTSQLIYRVVNEYAKPLGYKDLAAHDLRRTFAKLAHKGGAPIEQIQITLGHASLRTTERYLGVEQDLTDAPCDHLGLRLE